MEKHWHPSQLQHEPERDAAKLHGGSASVTPVVTSDLLSSHSAPTLPIAAVLGWPVSTSLKRWVQFWNKCNKKKKNTSQDKEERISGTAPLTMSLLPRKERGMNAIVSVFGGVFEKGSLATERNSFTFLSNLVRTSLACSIWRVPHLNCVRFTRKKRQRQARSLQRPWGWNVSWRNRLRGPWKSQMRPVEGILASLLNSLCYLRAPGYFLLS